MLNVSDYGYHRWHRPSWWYFASQWDRPFGCCYSGSNSWSHGERCCQCFSMQDHRARWGLTINHYFYEHWLMFRPTNCFRKISKESWIVWSISCLVIVKSCSIRRLSQRRWPSSWASICKDHMKSIWWRNWPSLESLNSMPMFKKSRKSIVWTLSSAR